MNKPSSRNNISNDQLQVFGNCDHVTMDDVGIEGMDQALGSTSSTYDPHQNAGDPDGSIWITAERLSNSHTPATCQMHKLDSLSRLLEFLDVLGKHWFQKHPKWLSALHGAWDGMTAWDLHAAFWSSALVYSTDSVDCFKSIEIDPAGVQGWLWHSRQGPRFHLTWSRFKFGPQGTSLNEEACRGQDVHRIVSLRLWNFCSVAGDSQ